MKFVITLKSPDHIADSVQKAVDASLLHSNLDDDEHEAALDIRREAVWSKLKKWIEYREYIRIEFDLDAGTATVLPVRR